MKTSLPYLLVMLLCLPIVAAGQSRIKYFEDCQSLSNRWVRQGDTVIIRCDSTVLLNKKTFSIYRNTYTNTRNNNALLKETLDTYEFWSRQQENRIQQQKTEYDSLKNNFDKLALKSTEVSTQTQMKLNDVSQSLKTVETNLNAAQNSLNEAQKLIKKESRMNWLRRLAWGGGGVSVGLLVATVLFGVAK